MGNVKGSWKCELIRNTDMEIMKTKLLNKTVAMLFYSSSQANNKLDCLSTLPQIKKMKDLFCCAKGLQEEASKCSARALPLPHAHSAQTAALLLPPSTRQATGSWCPNSPCLPAFLMNTVVFITTMK